MSVAHRIIGLACGLVLLAGCQTVDNTIWPSLTGEQPPSTSSKTATTGSSSQTQQTSAKTTAPATPATSPMVQEPVLDASSYGTTGTTVSKKVRQIATELQTLQKTINQNQSAYSQQLNTAEQNGRSYYTTIAAITARLQIGTTPGNPVLQSQYSIAQSQLNSVANDISSLNTLATAISSNASTSADISNAIDGTLRLSGAVEEDHRQLRELQDLNGRASVSIQNLRSDINTAIQSQTGYVNVERTRMSQLALAISNGGFYGAALADQGTQPAPASLSGPGALAGREPLVVIRFDRQNVPYQQPLYKAVRAALQRKPSAVFDLVAVAPNTGKAGDIALASTQVKHNAEDVLRSLTEMGLPNSRITLSATTSNDVKVNEVLIYVR